MLVQSEIGSLKMVLIHRPDSGIARVSPKQSDDLLFDDIVFYPQMLEEHRVFVDVLALFLGLENVIEIEDLLCESLVKEGDNKHLFLGEILQSEGLPPLYLTYLEELSDVDLAQTLITGYHKKRDHFLFDPIPNFIFTRDIAVMVNDHLILTKAAKRARHRENLIVEFIFYNHEIFKPLVNTDKIINLNNGELFMPSKMGEPIAIEGGDIMMLDTDTLLVGCSERSNAYTIGRLKQELFKRKVVEKVVQINIPPSRTYMHIDTVMTWVSDDVLVNYKPLIYEGIGSSVQVNYRNGKVLDFGSVKEYILRQVNPHTQFVFSGNGLSPYQEREQWTDGCNLVVIKPGVALTYDRNTHTELGFKKLGFKIMPARELLKQAQSPNFDIDSIERTIITLPSAELSRARGGSHCMTCPLHREILPE
ncbi:arginine deiminase family protein [Membranihabitans marinus]|uniref:arginine deiminase family protein n=1 Tax=Membranihabitans marinus TaxID=1227546 RepID=UPI001F2564AE|nr:arginine deiminase family protein [Membranihabitans marinus]